jgi:hypothetical protein
MSFKENNYPVEVLQGNVTIPRETHATIRARIRRHDPDNISATPYYAGLTGKSLTITYTTVVASVVTNNTASVTFTSNDYAAAIVAINAIDPPNLQALDLGGFLAVQNINLGKTHRIEINPYATPVNDAAPILGFAVTPFDGSISYVNELATAPAIRNQSNPQGTALIGAGETLSASAINRGLSSVLSFAERFALDLERLVVVFKDVDLTFTYQAASAAYHANINNDAIRLPILNIATTANGTGLSQNDRTTIQEKYFRLLHGSGGTGNGYNDVLPGMTAFTSGQGNKFHQWFEQTINDAFYGTNLTTYTPDNRFATWGTPDGKSIYGINPDKDKMASTAVTSITGNLIYCAGATFLSKKVFPGDLVQLSAAVLDPFDHSGWFAVDTVYDETHITVRPLGPSEPHPSNGNDNTPRGLNPAAGGTLRIPMGYWIPAGSIHLVANFDSAGNSFYTDYGEPSALQGNVVVRVRIACAATLREALTGEWGNVGRGLFSLLLSTLNDHITNQGNQGAGRDTFAHAAKAIVTDGFIGNWNDGTVIAQSTDSLFTALQTMATVFHSQTTPNSGAEKIGSAAVSLGGAAPNSLSAGSIYSQIVALLTDVQTATNYAGGGNWADGTTNPATTVEAQLDKIISDLAGSTGTGKIKGSAVGSDLVAETLALQITDLVNNWGKLSRANTWTALQSFAAALTAGANLLGSAANARTSRVSTPYSSAFAYTLLWQSFPDSGTHAAIRIYANQTGQLYITFNASYDGANWNKDLAGSNASLWVLRDGHVEQFGMVSDTAWATWTQILKTSIPQATTTTNNAFEPLLEVFDSSANRRVALDHNGFSGGRISVVREEWLDIPSTSIANNTVIRNWTFQTSDSAKAKNYRAYFSSASSGFFGLRQQFTDGTVQAVHAFSTALFSCTGTTFPQPNIVIAMEWETDASSVHSDGGDTFCFQGLADGPSSSNQTAFYTSASNANWHFLTSHISGFGTTDINTGVAVSGTQRMRIEAYGANAPGGNRILAYINGTLVAQSTTNLPQTPDIGMLFEMSRTIGTGGALNVYISPVLLQYKRLLSDDAL